MAPSSDNMSGVDSKNLVESPTTTRITGPGSSDAAALRPDTDSELVSRGLHVLEAKKVHWWSYLTTTDFWIVLVAGQVLALCITATNTFSGLLGAAGTNIPAFQNIFNYILLLLIWWPICIWHMGIKAWFRIVWRDGWKYFILSFIDVQGNYFTVLAYGYTNILSAQLINFWAIVVVVLLSFFFLKVRYRPFQIVGILVACGGMGLLIASDYIKGGSGDAANKLKGDLFALLGATCYGLTNTFEEFLVSKRPVYEVLSFMALFGSCILAVQATIFDRRSIQEAEFNGQIASYIVGFTLCLSFFYSIVPVVLRLASAAFYNISLLTANFWGVIIGIHVFGLAIHFLYPIAFVLIIAGLVTYFLAGSMLGDSKKPWLGDNQEGGVAGFGTAKLKAMNAARAEQGDVEAR
ncbi:solute carrier family 35 member F1 [Verticillium alfalfae VaMs.102]|uniref:Solute carrier family 35 member F1 n=1 Tax=Verticillium alfalfae (strain VaMs.102 / ATCC MYA-4576 / FGSC 10136) TaxID=526221 RepID=C9S9Q1_VERA1|nr:solute carrier family 35 member F1 [Verticillium alfalfae VaMs.102]EEY16114.1 solute carrier family 35 member F1 [Verticillium alfalfae VaMs.102]